jgi:hypothetical protein
VAAVNEDPVFGGLCIKHATKGIMVTTSWVTKDGHDNGEPRHPACHAEIAFHQ